MRRALLLATISACRPVATGTHEPASFAAADRPAAPERPADPPATLATLVPGPPTDPADRDADGVPNATDRCPDEPEDHDQFEDDDGCVDRDNDGDGILDAHEFIAGRWTNCDRDPATGQDCRNLPEDFDGYHDRDGCMDMVCFLEPCEIGVEDPVHFDARGRLDRSAAAQFDRVVGSLRGMPDVRVFVTAHVDSTRSDKDSHALTARIAAQVADELVRRGIARERIDPRSFGERSPVADNRTPEGRAANRRVMFAIPDDACTLARVGGPAVCK